MSDAEAALKRKALMAGVPYSTLLNVYKRGIGAFKTNPQSPAAKGVKSKEQWAFGRVAAFIEKRPTVYYGADDDLRRKAGLK
jgi:hypothetical protein